MEKTLKIPPGLGSPKLQQMSGLTANTLERESPQVFSWLSVFWEASGKIALSEELSFLEIRIIV